MPTRKPSKYGNNFRSNKSQYNPRQSKTVEFSSLRASELTSQDERIQATRLAHSIDESMGFPRFESGKKRVGWLCNMHSTTMEDSKIPGGRAGVDFYFLGENDENFKATVEHDPYFLIAVKRGREAEVEEYCKRMFEGLVKGVSRVEKEDLQMPNHLLGYRRTLLHLSFANVSDLLAVRKTIMPIAEKNKSSLTAMDTYAEVASANAGFDMFDDERIDDRQKTSILEASDFIVDIREYDVPYHVRVAIDKDIRIGKWYTVEATHGVVSLTCIEDRLQRADPVVLAYDIETTKLPLKFPDAAIDQVMMISYMIDGQGFLITNREIVSEDISDFDYTPKPEYDGPFLVFNEPDEKALLERFFLHIKEARPTVIATYNGDFFDWPFVEARASVLGIDMYRETGFRKNSEDIYQSDYCVHMDCFSWVNRDSYLPQGSRGLKAVTVAKLGYDPDELDPELMTPYASERPQTLAEYSVSDAVATYYLYMKYVHPFIFSLCTIIPLNPDDTLRKGTGTLCEMLLMVQAYQKKIVLPNKHKEPREAFWDGHLLESETYVGGHVESIEAGVFRADIPVNFAVEPAAIDGLLDDLDNALQFCITVEEKKSLEDVTNYAEVKAEIAEKLRQLKEAPNRLENPLIYHLDVASMYPNIMTTNRLQPDSMISESDCAACDFNRPGKTCDRRLPWSWRGEFLPPKRDEYNMIKRAVTNEKFPPKVNKKGPPRTFEELSLDDQSAAVKKRLTEYSKKIYHKIHDTKTIEREAIICQRENPFYVDTVRNFRDRRYDFKGQQKVWKGKTEALKTSGAPATEIEEAKKMIILFDSLQLAHKVILNSFYGYVMRKGSRWYSMEMAGVTCLTGAHIIQMARELVERIGRPLELDTDGIWCMLPATFPENVTLNLKNGKKLAVSYPCIMLNHLVHQKFTNDQYQTLVDTSTFKYETHKDNSIFFEVDGPYRAMILPTSKEEDKNLKKRYAVFNHDGSLAELKGFEVKRRGELKLIKIFQTQIFKFFLEGTDLTETYGAVARVANRWLDVLHSHGSTLVDEELIDLICENKSMAKTLAEYGAQKSTSITTAKRLADFLGEQMIKDKGLNVKYIISSRPKNAPVTERALPVAIFSAEESVKRFFLRKWLKEDPGDMDPRSVIDWNYYLERLGSVIQKLITIPAALQKVRNPVPRVAHPEWLQRRINTKEDKLKQKKMTDLFEKKVLGQLSLNTLDHRLPSSMDIEDALDSEIRSKAQQKSVEQSRVSQKRKSPEPAKTVLDPFASLPAKMPSISKDYPAWLRYQKQKWKIQAQARIRRRQLFGEKAPATTDSLGSLFRTQAELLYVNTWQVLQLRETGSPGEVRAFVLIGSKVHPLTIRVPRQLLLNMKSEDLHDVDIPGCEVEWVNSALPNGHASAHLFKVTLPETTYVQEAEKVAELCNQPGVEGVYEKQVPLHIRALLKLGGLCSFDESQKGALGKGLEQGFDLSALLRSSTKDPYLKEPSRMGYLCISHVLAGERQVFTLFSSERAEGHVVILTPKKDAQGLPNFDRIYAEQLRLRSESVSAGDNSWQSVFQYQDKIHFRTTQVSSRRKAHLELGDVIKKWRKEETKATMMVMYSPQQRQLVHDVSVLRDYPVLALRTDSEDESLPPIGWQAIAAKRGVSNYLTLNSWIVHLLQYARYGDIPLCNLACEDPRFLLDIAYARRLQKNNVVLWWSERPLPDHGGHEKDDVVGPLGDVVQMPKINAAGAYSSVCVDVEVRNLAINTILTSSLINELEAKDGVAFNPADQDEGEDGTFASSNAFANAPLQVLREMVKAWWAEACRGHVLADLMVQHLIRWIESPASCLYDRTLNYYVQTMSKKAFQQLMMDFRRVGSQIIYASNNRLILQTSKQDVGNAYAYTQYILKSIQQKPLFKFLDLEVKDYWDVLLWYDAYNYGGKGTSNIDATTTSATLDTIMHWQLGQYLPLPLQTDFSEWIVTYIDLLQSLKHPPTNSDSTPSSPSETPRPTQIPMFTPLTNDPTSTEITTFLREPFSRPFKRSIATLIRRQRDELLHPELQSDWSFPSHHPSGSLAASNRNPVLELVKAVMQIVSLSAPLQLETRLLRKELLTLFEVREFSDEARFTNPAARGGALVNFEATSCHSCTVLRDLDLARDEDLLPLLPEDNDGGSGDQVLIQRPWRCRSCNAEFRRLAIQEKLVQRVQRVVLEWQMQDLKCGKCGVCQGDTGVFAEHCGCGGEWKGTVDRAKVREGLAGVERVAKAHGLEMVLKVLEGVGRLR